MLREGTAPLSLSVGMTFWLTHKQIADEIQPRLNQDSIVFCGAMKTVLMPKEMDGRFVVAHEVSRQ